MRVALLLAARALAGDVTVLVDNKPATVGQFPFPSSSFKTLSLDNGLVKFTFGYGSKTMLLQSAIMQGQELATNLTGESFYIDAGGGTSSLVCDQVNVIRLGPDLAEVSFSDHTSNPLRHEHHLIMTSTVAGLYGYDIMRTTARTTISEVRMNVRWDRCIFNHSHNFERSTGQQPTYAYLYTQDKVQDETWRVDGVNKPDLACPNDNAGHLAPGTVYTKYDWSVYHHENPFFGHLGNGFGAWFTPLGGVTEGTSAASYGVGPNHQDLAIHQDTIVLDYMGANHYGLPGYSIPDGYTRLYGPWLTHLSTGADLKTLLAGAAKTASAAIAASIPALPLISDKLYPLARTTVHGRVVIVDGRPALGAYCLLSVEAIDVVYDIHESTYFVKADAAGNFSIPGVPAGTYSMYVFSSKGSITGQYRGDGLVVSGPDMDVGDVVWAPINHPTFLWQIGVADRMGGEFAGGNQPRSWDLPGTVAGDLTFTPGTSHEAKDWWYAQTQGGTWTVSFTLTEALTGTAYLTVSASLTDGYSPTVAVNGNANAITSGSMPTGTDSTLSRQAVRSGYPRLSVLTFDATALVKGVNTITFARPAAGNQNNNTGMGYDTVVLEVDVAAAPPAVLAAEAVVAHRGNGRWEATLSLSNTGASTAYGLRLTSVVLEPSSPAATLGCGGFALSGRRLHNALAPALEGHDLERCPAPISGPLPVGGAVDFSVALVAPYLAATPSAGSVPVDLVLHVEAAGGRVRSVVRVPAVGFAAVGAVGAQCAAF